MKARLTTLCLASSKADPKDVTEENGRKFLKPGVVIDEKDCWKLVLLGLAEPADEECEEKVKDNQSAASPLHREYHDRVMTEFEEFEQQIADELEDDDDDEI